MKNFLFLTSTNLAANPRLVKELHLAVSHGFSCTVLQFYLGNWSDSMTLRLQDQFPSVRFINLSASRRPFLPWLISSLLQTFYRVLPIAWLRGRNLSVAANKRSYLLMEQMQSMDESYQWVIAHNPASFFPALCLSKKTGAKLGVDVEDYHPGETTIEKETLLMQRLMTTVLPQAAYTSYASPSILKKVESVITFGDVQNRHVVINGFPRTQFVEAPSSETPALRFVWFSQFIDAGRGLEMILSVVEQTFPKVELHLIGNRRATFFNEHIMGRAGIFHHAAMPQQELHSFLSSFDVGLALEPGRDENNELALSNKMIAYAQSGLFILASHTISQDEFLTNSTLQYKQSDLSEEALLKIVLELYDLKEEIRAGRAHRFQIGRNYDWEVISKGLLAEWRK